MVGGRPRRAARAIWRTRSGATWEFTIDGIIDRSSGSAAQFLFHYEYLDGSERPWARLRRSVQRPRRRFGAVSRDHGRDRFPLRQLAGRDPDDNRAGVPEEPGRAARERRGDTGRHPRRGVLHAAAHHDQHDGAGDPRADERSGGAEDARLHERPRPGPGPARGGAAGGRGRLGRPRAGLPRSLSGGDPTGGFLPEFAIPPRGLAIGAGLVIASGAISAAWPGLQATRLRIVDGLGM